MSDPASLDALIAQWQAEAHERRETAREAEAKELLLTAVSLYKEAEQLQECADELAALLHTRKLQETVHEIPFPWDPRVQPEDAQPLVPAEQKGNLRLEYDGRTLEAVLDALACRLHTATKESEYEAVADEIETVAGRLWLYTELNRPAELSIKLAVAEAEIRRLTKPPLVPADTRTDDEEPNQPEPMDALSTDFKQFVETREQHATDLSDLGCVRQILSADMTHEPHTAPLPEPSPPLPVPSVAGCVYALVQEVRSLRASLGVVPPPPAAWQPIETAPHEGEVLVHDDGAVLLAFWHEGFWLDSAGAAGNQRIDPPPQHWMPKPVPPVPAQIPTQDER